MSTGFPTTLDASSVVGDAVAAIETRLGVTGSTDPASVTYQLSQVVPQLPHRTGGTFFVHSATGDGYPSNALTVELIYAIPFYVPSDASYSKVGVIRTLSMSGGYERLGVYTDGCGVPDVLIADWGYTASSSVGESGFRAIACPSTALEGGWVWLACACQGGVNTLFSTVGTSTGAPVVLGTSAPSASGMTMGYSGESTSGQLPSDWGGTFTECSTVPIVYVARD